jgi:hypothetical protein
MQKDGSDWYGVAIATHAEYISGDKMLWLQENLAGIDWTGNETLKAQIEEYVPR